MRRRKRMRREEEEEEEDYEEEEAKKSDVNMYTSRKGLKTVFISGFRLISALQGKFDGKNC